MLIEVQCGVQVDEQTLIFQGSYLQENSSKLKHLGMRNNDIGKEIILKLLREIF